MHFNSYPVPQLPVCLTMWLRCGQFRASTLREAPHWFRLFKDLLNFRQVPAAVLSSGTALSFGLLTHSFSLAISEPMVSETLALQTVRSVDTAHGGRQKGEVMVSTLQPEHLSAHKCHLLSQQSYRIKTLRLKPRFLVQIFALSTEKKK